MAVIKSGNSTDQWSIDPASKAGRVTAYDTVGNVIAVAQDGTDGATPPVIAGTGIRGWLRAIYDKLNAPLAVTGTFFQATQPVSGAFFQATQPVSASSLPLPSGASTETTLALIKAKTDNLDVALSTRTKPADTQPVSLASQPLPTGASTEVTLALIKAKTDNLDVLLSTRTKPADTQPVSAASLPLPTGAATDASVTNGTQKTQIVNGSGVVVDVTAKGVQGANFAAVQNARDSGRVIKILQAVFTPAVAETMVTLTPVVDGVAGSTGTSFTVTAGKRFRITALLLSITNSTAAIRGTQVTLRMSSTGAVTTASPMIGAVGATTAAATAQLAAAQAQAFPDGIELTGTMQIGVSATGIVLAGSTVSVVGYEY